MVLKVEGDGGRIHFIGVSAVNLNSLTKCSDAAALVITQDKTGRRSVLLYWDYSGSFQQRLDLRFGLLDGQAGKYGFFGRQRFHGIPAVVCVHQYKTIKTNAGVTL